LLGGGEAAQQNLLNPSSHEGRQRCLFGPLPLPNRQAFQQPDTTYQNHLDEVLDGWTEIRIGRSLAIEGE